MEAAAPLQETESNERQMLAEGIVRNLIDDLADGALEGDVDAKALALEFIRSRAEWQAEYESRLRHFEEEDVQEARFAIILEDRRRHTRSIEFSREGGVGSFGDIMPGSYTLSLDTGLLLWQGELTQSDLLWAEAFPDEPLAMAAETEEAAGRPTIEEALLDGSIRLRVFPGVESGRMEIQAKPFPGIGA
ncbi:MAG: hypothetical protein NTW86_15585 [Candidatus Sumerlaeota bacterium]|nr:hypothetical protein [Candidatus Sumerlaeota bacterium]